MNKTKAPDLVSFEDGKFSFWTAHYGSWAGDKRIVFRVREDRTPKERADEKDIDGWDRILPASPHEEAMWRISHPTFKPLLDK
jgi:hypothetical protein